MRQRSSRAEHPGDAGRRAGVYWRRWRATLVAACVLGASAAVVLAGSGAAAGTTGPPTFYSQQPWIEGLPYLTSIAPPGIKAAEPNGLETGWIVEYQEEGAGSWTTVCSGTISQAEAEKQANFRIEREAFGCDEITGLKYETNYVFRAKLKNADGEISAQRVERTTRRNPLGLSVEPRDVTGDSAQLDGGVAPQDSETSWRIEYSTSETSGWKVVGSGTVSQAEAEQWPKGGEPALRSVHLSGLAPATTYFVRIAAENAFGEGEAGNGAAPGQPALVPSVKSFRTGGAPSADTFATHSFDGEAIRALGSVEPGANPTNELQQVSVASGSAGSFKLCLQGECTRPIAVEEENKLREAIGFALGELATLNANGRYERPVLAYGGAVDGAFVVEFYNGPYSGRDVPQLTVDASGLSAGSVSVSTVENGSPMEVHYHFEYTPLAVFEESGFAGAVSAPAVEGSGVIGEALSELKAGETYAVRLSATNATAGNPVVYGEAQRIAVPAAVKAQPQAPCSNEGLRTGASAGLPDCRAYEQVTPVEKGGAESVFKYNQNDEGSLVGEDGDHLVLMDPGVAWGPNPDESLAEYFFTRGERGWDMRSVRPAGDVSGLSYRPRLFTGNLEAIGLEAESTPTPVSRSKDVQIMVGPPGGPYTQAASVPRGLVVPTPFLTESEQMLAGSSADARKVVFQTTDRKLAGKPTGTVSGNDLYEYSEGQLRQVNVGAGACGARLVQGFEGYEGRPNVSRAMSSAHALSSDGSRVFFEAVPGSNCSAKRHLYVRENGGQADQRTVDLGEYSFVAASADGARVLAQGPTAAGSRLYLLEVEDGTVTPLIQTAEPLFVGEPHDQNEYNPVVSEDLSTIYFFSHEQLTPEAPSTRKEGNTADIYKYDVGARSLRFVARNLATSGAGYGGHSVSPDGRFFYWLSREVAGTLGGGRDAKNVQYEQAYRYDSADDVVQCISCASPFDPQPSRPVTFSDVGTLVPESGMPVQRDASANGDFVFFDTTAALVRQDIDGEREPETIGTGELADKRYSPSSDVYEWRAYGVNGCGSVQGCVALISSGTGGHRVELLGVSASGRDVFFSSYAKLVENDRDSSGDVYDARLGGGFPGAPAGRAECEAGSCQVPAAPPVDLTPSSLTFGGPGNQAAVAVSPASKGRSIKRPTKKHARKRKLRKGTRRSRARHSRLVRGRRARHMKRVGGR